MMDFYTHHNALKTCSGTVVKTVAFKQEACQPDSSTIYKLAFWPQKIYQKPVQTLLKITHFALYLEVISGYVFCQNSYDKLGKVGVSLNIAQNHSSSPPPPLKKAYLVIICPNSYEKLIKSEIRLGWSQFDHCSKSLIQHLGNHIWSLFAPIHMKSWLQKYFWTFKMMYFVILGCTCTVHVYVNMIMMPYVWCKAEHIVYYNMKTRVCGSWK